MTNIAHLPAPRNTNANTIVADVRAELALADETQGKLAAALGQNEMWLSRRLKSAPAFTTDEVQAIADYFGIPVGDLFAKKDRPRRNTGVGPAGIEPTTSTV
jgi:transcriptional regulator with XRE-family HTH domain